MKELIAVFRSRREAMSFGRALMKHGVRARALSTPSSIGSSCGLSVAFPASALALGKNLLVYGGYDSFGGFFGIE